MWDYPRLRNVIYLGAGSVSLFTIAGILAADNANPYLVGILAGLAAVLGAGSILEMTNWIVYEATRRQEEIKRVAAITPRLMLLHAAARLTPEQAALIPMEDYRADLGVIGTEEGPRYVLRTAGGDVPMEFVADFLERCGAWELQAIRDYPDKTPAREYAQLITSWLIAKRLADPASGNRAARWMTDQSKRRALSMLGLSE